MTLTLLDTTILSNFAHTQCPDLVQVVLGDHAATTAAVLAELRRGEALGLVPHVDWRWLLQVALTRGEQELAVRYRHIVDEGEAECLAIAIVRNFRFLTDDLAARRLAQANNVSVSGTIGLLLQLINKGNLTVTEADDLLALMKQQGYRSPVASLRAYREE